MYLNKSQRQLCWIFVALDLFLLGIFLLVTGGGQDRGLVPALVIAGVFLLPAGIPLLRYYTCEASRLDPSPDILRDQLHLSRLIERCGVQYCAILVPDEAGPEGIVSLVAFLQNCHSTPRSLVLSVERPPIEPLAASGCSSVEVTIRKNGWWFQATLEGGETGVLRIAGKVPAGTRPGEYPVRYRVHVKRPRAVGRRRIALDGWRPGIGETGIGLHLAVRPSGHEPADPVSAGTEYFVIFRPGMTGPALDRLTFLCDGA